MARLICRLIGHHWDRVQEAGFATLILPGARCRRCDVISHEE
jgi:hypothetical protein